MTRRRTARTSLARTRNSSTLALQAPTNLPFLADAVVTWRLALVWMADMCADAAQNAALRFVLEGSGHFDTAPIVQYLGCARDVLHGEQYILMEYVVGGTVKAMLARSYPRGLPLTAVQRYGRHLLSGLHFLHEAMIIHSDLKGDNLLVDLSRATPGAEGDDSEWGRLKIADFGSSRELSGSGTHSMHEHALRGSPYWLAPEAIRGVGAGRKADVWALGGVLLEMLTGKPPWFEEQATPPGQFAVFQILNRIVTATGPPPLPPAETMPPALHDLLLACFERNLAKRPTTTQLLAHPWIGVTDADAES